MAVDLVIQDLEIASESVAVYLCRPGVSYGFTAEWEASKTRTGHGRIELFQPGKYDLSLLTIQEDWVRQGVARYTMDLELWYGRYQHLPYVEDVELRVIPGETIATGSEIIANGWFSIRVDGSAYVPIYEDTVVHLGPMYSHSKKLVGFKLLVPETAQTKKYVHLQIEAIPKMMRTWGRFPWGVGIYGSDIDLYDFSPQTILYRAYVFDAQMWDALLQAGIVASPFWRGEDKQW